MKYKVITILYAFCYTFHSILCNDSDYGKNIMLLCDFDNYYNKTTCIQNKCEAPNMLTSFFYKEKETNIAAELFGEDCKNIFKNLDCTYNKKELVCNIKTPSIIKPSMMPLSLTTLKPITISVPTRKPTRPTNTTTTYNCNSNANYELCSPWPHFGGIFNYEIKNYGYRVSPFTCSSTGTPKWKFSETSESFISSPAIGSDGTIYIGSVLNNGGNVYAIYSNGTLKWKFNGINESFISSPAIGSDGTIYIGSYYYNININTNTNNPELIQYGYVYAIYPNGTLKWRFNGNINEMFLSSPSIDHDGTIYIGSVSISIQMSGGYGDTNIYAIYPNGTLKWNFNGKNEIFLSSPSIDKDDTIYFTSMASALEPQTEVTYSHIYSIFKNGTLKWNFTSTEGFVSSPSIGYDGTVYTASLNGSIYAIQQNGMEKWKINILYNWFLSSPAISKDGIIYIGSLLRINQKFSQGNVYAIYTNGTQKWSFTDTNHSFISSPVIDSEGTIYIGSSNSNILMSDNNALYAIYTNGTQKWKQITEETDTVIHDTFLFLFANFYKSSPAIGSDGTIYIGSVKGVYAIGET